MKHQPVACRGLYTRADQRLITAVILLAQYTASLEEEAGVEKYSLADPPAAKDAESVSSGMADEPELRHNPEVILDTAPCKHFWLCDGSRDPWDLTAGVSSDSCWWGSAAWNAAWPASMGWYGEGGCIAYDDHLAFETQEVELYSWQCGLAGATKYPTSSVIIVGDDNDYPDYKLLHAVGSHEAASWDTTGRERVRAQIVSNIRCTLHRLLHTQDVEQILFTNLDTMRKRRPELVESVPNHTIQGLQKSTGYHIGMQIWCVSNAPGTKAIRVG